MSEQREIKVCKMCAMEIPAKAKKCPHCHHWQSRFRMVVWHPAFAVIFFLIPMVAYAIMMDTLLGRGEDFQPYRDQVKVLDSEIRFSDDPNCERVIVVGRLKNDSDLDWKELILSVEFCDAEGKLVDGGQDMKYSYYIAAHDEGSFRVLFQRLFPKESYAACKVRVVYAKDGKTMF